MRALLEIKQKLKLFYGSFEAFILPIVKFAIAAAYFLWINENMGFMPELKNMYVVLVLALLCSITPNGLTVFIGWALILGHCYAIGLETAAFFLVLVLFMYVFLLRLSAGRNIVLAFAPLSYTYNVPVLLPIGSGLLGNAASALPAGCGVIQYYLIRTINTQSQVLMDPEVQMLAKVELLTDCLVQNWAMWVNVIAVVLVIVVVYIIRSRAFDFAWRIAIVTGGIVYVLVMLGGGYYLNVKINMGPLVTYTLIAVVIGLVLEFFVFGGDYSRVERLQYDDDDYHYYVKAVPKSSIAKSERSIKKINAEPVKEENKRKEENALTYANPIFRGEEKAPVADDNDEPLMVNDELEDIDFESKLEESLRDL